MTKSKLARGLICYSLLFCHRAFADHAGLSEAELGGYEQKTLLIVGAASTPEAAARILPATKPVRVLPSDRFTGLKPGSFIRVLDKFDSDAEGKSALKAAKASVPDAYLKRAGRLVPLDGLEHRKAADEQAKAIDAIAVSIEEKMRSSGQSAFSVKETVGRLAASRFPEQDADKPLQVALVFSESRLNREESYYFSKGALVLARTRTAWDFDQPKDAPEDNTVESLYIADGQGFKFEKKLLPFGQPEVVDALSYKKKDVASLLKRLALIKELIDKKAKTSEERFLLLDADPFD